jgi:hypothetical protein
MEELKFIAEVKEVKSKKLASMDISYRVILETDDPKVLALGVLEADKLLKVVVSENE